MLPILLSVLPSIIDKVFPDAKAADEAKLKVMEMAQKGELAQLDADMRLAVAQLEVNKAEAASGNMFTAGWRPAVGWICAAGLAYEFLIAPMLPWLALAVFGKQLPDLPDLPMETLLTLLLGMLGLGGLRTVEKVKGVAS
jgi:hypothetical protein